MNGYTDLLTTTPNGLYCAAGDFYIDPWRKVKRAVITHAHSDHARAGSETYLCTPDGYFPLRLRIGKQAKIKTLAYASPLKVGDVTLQFFPAGHIVGSAQVLIEYNGWRWVVSGDYNTEPNNTCKPFEVVPCHVFITESTFGLPIYKWQKQQHIFDGIHAWWKDNAGKGLVSVLQGYSLGKAQRILGNLNTTLGPVFVHPSIAEVNKAYADAGISLPATVTEKYDAQKHIGAMVIAPPGTQDGPWMQHFTETRTAFVSGWMAVRNRRRSGNRWQNIDAGFALSDHADWPGLLQTIRDTGAERVLVTHGFVDTLVAYLNEIGITAAPLQTEFKGDDVAKDISTHPSPA